MYTKFFRGVVITNSELKALLDFFSFQRKCSILYIWFNFFLSDEEDIGV